MRWQRRRAGKKPPLPFYLDDMVRDPEHCYLPTDMAPERLELADPLCVLEKGEAPARPLPPMFLTAGTADPIMDDTRRMKLALDALGVRSEMHIYEGEIHAFHALVFKRPARDCWRKMLRFTERALADSGE